MSSLFDRSASDGAVGLDHVDRKVPVSILSRCHTRIIDRWFVVRVSGTCWNRGVSLEPGHYQVASGHEIVSKGGNDVIICPTDVITIQAQLFTQLIHDDNAVIVLSDNADRL